MRLRNVAETALAGFALLAAGCGDEPPSAPVAPPPVAAAWSGTFGSGDEAGYAVVDLVQRDATLLGDVVLWSPALVSAGAAPLRYRVAGTAPADSIRVASIANPTAFHMQCEVFGLGGLRGTLTLTDPIVLQVAVECNRIVRGPAPTGAGIELGGAGKALAFDGTQLWIPTVGNDHLLVDPRGSVTGSVAVFLRANTHWTSDALTFDGQRLWGHLPVTTVAPGGSRNTSRLYAFDLHGVVVDSLEIDHRTSGLAYDGSFLWSLDAASPRRHRLDAAGQVTASVALRVPDPIHLEWDGRLFWTTGWLLPRLYALDFNGRVAAMFDLPAPGAFPGGLAYANGSMLCARTEIVPPSRTRLYHFDAWP